VILDYRPYLLKDQYDKIFLSDFVGVQMNQSETLEILQEKSVLYKT